MNRNKKIGVILIILIVLLLGLYVSLNIGLPDHQLSKGYWVTISGKILPSEKVNGGDFAPPSKNYVYAYYSYPTLMYLCRNEEIEATKIDWDSDNITGKYTISFNLPIEMDVILSVDCEGCNHTKVHVSPKENIKEINLFWDKDKCLIGEDYTSGDIETVLERVRSLLDYITSELNNRELNKSRMIEIKGDISRGWDEVTMAKSYKEVNESLLHAYYAHWYAERARYQLTLFDTEKCIQDTKEILAKRKETCYIPPFLGYLEYNQTNQSLSNELESNWLRHMSPYENKELEKMRKEIMGVYNAEERVGFWLGHCEESSDLIKKSLEAQEPYCIRRKSSILFINLMLGILIFIIGWLGGRWVKKRD